ncbi:MAG: lipid-A-disaccharide synthase [Holosporaceae bacterium]|jgi:lipid-A-disaccharide synthase|nr:lipid-A-disaccharide synthase [Holosporaceae bacterium]
MIGIVCGGGDYPRLVSRACVEKNLDFCLVFLNGFCDQCNWPEVKSISIDLGDIGKAIDFLNLNKVKDIVFAGKVKRPNFKQIFPDKKGRSWLLKLRKSIFAGDDALLRAVADLVHQEGFDIIAGTSLLDDVFFSPRIYSQRKPSKSDYNDIDIGLATAKELGITDLGQSVVVRNGMVIGKEDIHGTNALLEKCGGNAGKGGILVKISKPQQDNRFDLPTIGVETIETLHKNGFAGVVVEANKCIAIDKDKIINRADELNIFMMAVKLPSLKIFLIAGEASGDYLGGKLIDSISKIFRGNVEFLGIGGPCMEKSGLKKIFSIEELSLIGIAEVIGKIFRIKKLISQTVEQIQNHQPTIIVTVDSSGFTHRIAKKVKKMGCKIPLVHYVAPPVWAWRGWRAKFMHKFIDKLMVLFPFEPAYFEKYGLKTVFVGHPIAVDPEFRKPHSSQLRNFLNSVCKIKEREEYKIITLLPGSRMSEIVHHLPVLEKFMELMVSKYENIKFIIPTIENLEKKINDIICNWSQKPTIIMSKAQKILAYYSSDAAVAASGTVTLELARVGLPFVTIYKTSSITYLIVKFLIKIRDVCLINLLAKKNVVPELLQKDCTAENIFNCVEKILNTNESERQKNSFEEVIEILRSDPELSAKEIIYSALRGTPDGCQCDSSGA